MIAEVCLELECDKVPAMPVYLTRNQPQATASVCDSDGTKQHRDSRLRHKRGEHLHMDHISEKGNMGKFQYGLIFISRHRFQKL